jgi:hypothetical protein
MGQHAAVRSPSARTLWLAEQTSGRDEVCDFGRGLGRRRRDQQIAVARVLFRLRLFLGRIFRLDAEPKDTLVASFASRLTPEDRARSLVVSGTPEGPFRVVYRLEDEQLLEIQNRTVHAAALSALAERAGSYRFYFAVYVRQGTWITAFYMSLIDPFRKWMIYPAMLKQIRATWDQNI